MSFRERRNIRAKKKTAKEGKKSKKRGKRLAREQGKGRGVKKEGNTALTAVVTGKRYWEISQIAIVEVSLTDAIWVKLDTFQNPNF